MNIQEIMEKVNLVCKQISDNDPSVWYTNEWNICSHIQHKLEDQFLDYNIDIEPVKNDGRRPDIVIYKRGNNSDNLVAFQVKKNPSKGEIKTDIDKIKETFFLDPYFYKFGVFISVGKLPDGLPGHDSSRIGFMQVYGWEIMNANKKLI